ncbi:hypothetical protein LIER_30225 [Lithospermum erythrorhizon]|uniref:Uncharacterized protein n=1 Tax=Lithospermum erythrorhizon TaxID=34254 RepID=A0AAV3RQH6_LITER
MKNKSRKGKKSMRQQLKEGYEVGDLEVDLLGEPSDKGFDHYVLYSKPTLPDLVPNNTKDSMPEINMFQRASQNVSSGDFERDDIKHSWKVKNPLVRNSDGTSKQISGTEETLNWQYENALAQNSLVK